MSTHAKKPLQRRHIETLVAVADSHSVHRAARDLNMTQPAVSRLLVEAENLLGARLFERSVHGSRPTTQGASVLAHARFVLHGMQRLDLVMHEAKPMVRLGCIPRSMHTLMPHLLSRLFPNAGNDHAAAALRLSVMEDSSTVLFDAIVKGSLDFAILRHVSGAAGIGEDLAAERLYDERPSIICAADNPHIPQGTVGLAKLVDSGWILPSSETTSRAVLERFWIQQGLPPIRPVIETRTFESNLALVAETRFISIVPESIARRYADLGVVRVVNVRPALPASPVMLVYQPMSKDDPVLCHFRGIVHEAAAAIPVNPRR